MCSHTIMCSVLKLNSKLQLLKLTWQKLLLSVFLLVLILLFALMLFLFCMCSFNSLSPWTSSPLPEWRENLWNKFSRNVSQCFFPGCALQCFSGKLSSVFFRKCSYQALSLSGNAFFRKCFFRKCFFQAARFLQGRDFSVLSRNTNLQNCS